MITINKRKFILYGISLEERRSIGRNKSGVYVFLVLCNKSGKKCIKYIGRTENLMARLSSHTIIKKLLKELKREEEIKVAFLDIESWEDRRDIELELVRKYNPMYNIHLIRPYRGLKVKQKNKQFPNYNIPKPNNEKNNMASLRRS